MKEAMEGMSVGFGFQGVGPQSGLAWSPSSNVVTGGIGGSTNAGISIMGAKTYALFNIND
ncbi:MAG: hypothetical protein AAGU32_08015 [Bacillota bacterium]